MDGKTAVSSRRGMGESDLDVVGEDDTARALGLPGNPVSGHALGYGSQG